jgi:hypothetical protein
MDSAIDTATTEQGLIGSVDNGIRRQTSDIGAHNPNHDQLPGLARAKMAIAPALLLNDP